MFVKLTEDDEKYWNYSLSQELRNKLNFAVSSFFFNFTKFHHICKYVVKIRLLLLN